MRTPFTILFQRLKTSQANHKMVDRELLPSVWMVYKRMQYIGNYHHSQTFQMSFFYLNFLAMSIHTCSNGSFEFNPAGYRQKQNQKKKKKE
jgi:hypothetical protein